MGDSVEGIFILDDIVGFINESITWNLPIRISREFATRFPNTP